MHWHTLGPLHTQDWRHVSIDFNIYHLLKNAKIVQVHFTLEGEGPRFQRNYHG